MKYVKSNYHFFEKLISILIGKKKKLSFKNYIYFI